MGLLLDMLTSLFWVASRVFTRLKDPPRLNMTGYLVILVGPQAYGCMLGGGVMLLSQNVVYALFHASFLQNFPQTLDNLVTMTPPTQTQMYARIALCTCTIGVYTLYACGKVLIPDKRYAEEEEEEGDEEEEEEEELWAPEVWNRSHWLLTNLLATIPQNFLIEFSFSATYSVQLYICIFCIRARSAPRVRPRLQCARTRRRRERFFGRLGVRGWRWALRKPEGLHPNTGIPHVP